MLKRWGIITRVVLCCGLALLGILANRAAAQNVPQGYQANGSLQPGIIVRLKPGSSSEVEPQGQADQSSMLGVVVSQSDTPLSLSDNSSKAQTFVASNGQYDTLVSTQDGSVQSGDYVTVSSINGVGMKAGSSQQYVVGKALQGFDGKTGIVSTALLKGANNQNQTVQLGLIQVSIDVMHNPLYNAPNSSGVPRFLSSAAEVLTNHPVNPIRIYASLAVLAATLFIAGSVLYAGLRSGIIAIGRNPLAKRTITKSMVSVVIMSLIVFIIGIIAVYLLLKV